jgi:adenosylcobinamide-GDP ribazoletransferase
MPMRDVTSQLVQDLRAGFELLTRLPVPASLHAPRSDAAWCWPIVGIFVAGAGTGVAVLATKIGLPVATSALIMIVITSFISGALHEDGLADCADGFYGGRDKARRLAIMKDSQIGSYGTLALLVVVLLRWTLLTALLAVGAYAEVIFAAALSRALMAAVMAALPNARGEGLSQVVGRPTSIGAGVSVILAVLVGLVLVGFASVTMLVIAAGFAALVAWVALAKIGGQTGDVLGATQQISELGALLTAVAMIGM